MLVGFGLLSRIMKTRCRWAPPTRSGRHRRAGVCRRWHAAFKGSDVSSARHFVCLLLVGIIGLKATVGIDRAQLQALENRVLMRLWYEYDVFLPYYKESCCRIFRFSGSRDCKTILNM